MEGKIWVIAITYAIVTLILSVCRFLLSVWREIHLIQSSKCLNEMFCVCVCVCVSSSLLLCSINHCSVYKYQIEEMKLFCTTCYFLFLLAGPPNLDYKWHMNWTGIKFCSVFSSSGWKLLLLLLLINKQEVLALCNYQSATITTQQKTWLFRKSSESHLCADKAA